MSAEPLVEPADVVLPVRLPFPRLRRRQEAASAPVPTRRLWNGHDRRSADRLRKLARDYDALCTAAVDAAEIAAGLEASGFTDGSAHEYGYAGVFALAEVLFDRTPRLADRRPGRLANPWAERPLRHLARGVAFALPGLVLVACLPHLTTRADAVALVVAMLLGWPVSQTMAFVGHALEGRRHPMAARALLLLGLLAALLLAAGGAAAALASGVSRTVTTIAAGEIVYVAAASVVLVLSHELVLLATLVPGVAAAASERWLPGAPPALLAAGAAASVVLIGVAAVAGCSTARPRDVRAALGVLGGHDVTEAGFHLGYGLAGGLLVTLLTLGGPATAVGGLTLLPVIWSMGTAEWSVVWLRRRSFDLLNEAISVPVFQRSVRRLAVVSVARYLAPLTALAALLAAALRWGGIAVSTPHLVVALAASWLLGCGLYLALVLSSLGRVRTVVPWLLLAAALGLYCEVGVPDRAAVLAAPALLVAVLAPVLQRTVADPVRHM